MKKIALITIHGMGQTRTGYADPLIAKVRARLGPSRSEVLTVRSIYYQQQLQTNEELLWERCTRSRWLGWQALRRFMLFYFADAVGIEAGKDEVASSYTYAQAEIARKLLEARADMGGDGPVVAVAHSLGGQVLSCYLYDAQRARGARLRGRGAMPPAGVWRGGKASLEEALGQRLSDAELEYLGGSSVRALITIGCNIPIFVASHRGMSVKPIAPPVETGFEWHNYFNPNDALGWPLQPLGRGYETLVADHSILASNLLTCWNPFSHGAYWSDPSVIGAVAGQLARALGPREAGAGAAVRGLPSAAADA